MSRSHAVGFGALLEGGMDGRKDWKLLLLAGWALGEERSERGAVVGGCKGAGSGGGEHVK